LEEIKPDLEKLGKSYGTRLNSAAFAPSRSAAARHSGY
jgi:hypothetical protein